MSTKTSLLNLSVNKRLFAGFVAIMIPITVVIIFFLTKIIAIENYATHIKDISISTQNMSSLLGSQINETQSNLYNYILTNSASAKEDYDYAWLDIEQSQEDLNSLSNKWNDQALAKSWEELKKYYPPLRAAQQKLLDAAKSGATTATITGIIENDLTPIDKTMIDMIDGERSAVTKQREGGMSNGEANFVINQTASLLDTISKLKYLIWGLLFVSLGLATFISVLTSRSIVNPLDTATNIAKRIAAGERSIEIDITGSDEIAQLLAALAKMQSSIRENENNIKMNEAKTKTFLDSVLKTANKYSSHSSQLAAGNLNTHLEIDSDDVLAKLGNDLNSMTDRMRDIATKILKSSSNMAGKLEEVKALSNSQASGVTEQAASIQEITSSLEEIDKSSKQTMEKAKALGEVAKQTRDKGNLGMQSVEKIMQAMKVLHDKVQAIAQSILELSTQTQQVGEITAVVNTLAQQSKMLALNASIEAAKAGEAGKGFAVVAIEVKNLAEQSEQSTAQVQKILENIRHGAEKSVMVTEEGTRSVKDSSNLIENANEVVHSLNNMITEASIASQQIEAAIRQETISIEQITAGMNEINQVTNSFVHGVRETETAVNYITDIAQQLKEFVSIYRL